MSRYIDADNLISRQAAIDAICEECHMETDYHRCEGYKKDSRWCEYSTALNDLPSAQPDLDEWCTDVVEVVRCKDCKHRPKKVGNEGNGFDYEFSEEYACPGYCEDGYYAELFDDSFYCAWGER